MSGSHDDVPTLRYSRFGGGYRREDVEAALQQLLLSMRTVESDLDQLRARSTELEHELEKAQGEIQAYRAREAELQALIERAQAAVVRGEHGAEAT